MEKNFYYVTGITGDISTKYGVFVGNAVFIGTAANTTDYTPTLPSGVEIPDNAEPVKLLNDVVAAPATTAGSTTTVAATTAAPTTTGISANIIPTMTSNTTPSGIASASGIYQSNYDAWYAFAYNVANGDPQTWVSGGNNGWLQYQFPVAHAVIRYQITNRDEPMTRAPANWTFAGSNNGTSWTTLDTQSNPNWASSRATVFTIDIPNTTAYSYYRVTVAPKNFDQFIGIGRLEMYEATGL